MRSLRWRHVPHARYCGAGLVATYALYVLAFACWVPVVLLQIKAQRLAQQAAETGQSLGAEY